MSTYYYVGEYYAGVANEGKNNRLFVLLIVFQWTFEKGGGLVYMHTMWRFKTEFWVFLWSHIPWLSLTFFYFLFLWFHFVSFNYVRKWGCSERKFLKLKSFLCLESFYCFIVFFFCFRFLPFTGNLEYFLAKFNDLANKSNFPFQGKEKWNFQSWVWNERRQE